MDTATQDAPPMAASANHYVDKAELRACLIDYKRTGVLCNRLGLMLVEIARGVYDRWKFSPDPDDIASDCFYHLAYQAPLKRVDPEKNAVAFFTTCAVRFGIRRRNRWHADLRKAAEFRADRGRRLEAVLNDGRAGDYPAIYEAGGDKDYENENDKTSYLEAPPDLEGFRPAPA